MLFARRKTRQRRRSADPDGGTRHRNEIVPETVNVPPIVEPTAPPVAEIETTVSVEQQLFGDEQTVRPRMDKQVILSLYGDAPTQPTHPHNPTPQARSYEAPHPAPPLLRRNRPDKTAGFRHGRPQKVLGETFANGNGVAMNEVLGKQTAHADVASKLQSQSISGDLRQCIGINDRFMLIRSLFNGNADQYAAAIAQLNAFYQDLNERAAVHSGKAISGIRTAKECGCSWICWNVNWVDADGQAVSRPDPDRKHG